ncbi:MAG: outer membrane beta-barrel protein [Polyangiales bacterium]
MTHTLRFAPLALAAAFALAPAAARAEWPDDDHFEATMGFLLTREDHRATGFSASSNAAPLTEAFRAAPYDGTLGAGLRYDLRLVLSHVRMTAGFDLPFTSLGNAPARDVDGHRVAPRSLQSWGVRFGLGAEYPVGPVTPFADLQGSLLRTSTELTVDGATAAYDATRFGFSVRAGVRVRLKRWFFVSAAGEYGVTGATQWSADLGVGFRVGS